MNGECMAVSGSSEVRYSNGPDSGCLATIKDNVVAADEGENHLL